MTEFINNIKFAWTYVKGEKVNLFKVILLEIAKNLKDMGLSVSDIMKATSLSKTSIQNL